MTIRQTIIKLFYPAIRMVSGLVGSKKEYLSNPGNAQPLESLFDLSFTSMANEDITLKQFKGKKILLVNTASDCGFTPQLKELQQLQDKYKNSLVVLGFPSNDFKEQEKGSDSEIETFCKINFGVQFLLAGKTVVIKNQQQHPIFQWLTNKHKNGWNSKPPGWNFTKYLINENGVLTNIFGPTTSPLSNQLISKL